MLIEAGKRFLVLHGKSAKHKPDEDQAFGRVESGPLILEALKRQAVLNNRMFIGDRAALLLGAGDQLAAALKAGGLRQADIGRVLGRSQSAVSRLSKKSDADEGVLEGAIHG